MKKAVRIIILLTVISFIYYMSAQNSVKSFFYNVEIVRILRINCGIDLYSLFNNNYVDIIVRKLGHFFEFSILSAALYSALSAFKVKRVTILTCIFSITLALLDEYHQLYVLGRSCRIIDVFIDSSGIIMTISAISFIKAINHELFIQRNKHGMNNDRSLLK